MGVEEKKEEKHEDAQSRGEAERKAQEAQIAADNQQRQIRMGVIEDPNAEPTEPEAKKEEPESKPKRSSRKKSE